MTPEAYAEALRRKAQRVAARSPGMERMPAAAAGPQREGAARTATFEAVIRWYRPVLRIRDDRFVTPEGPSRFEDPNAEASRQLLEELENRRAVIDPAIRSVGRIELINNVQFPWVGTGWIVDTELGNDIVVTNAHVAREFGMQAGSGFVFRPGVPDYTTPQSGRIDFREELGGAAPREFPITEIIWISNVPSLDIALLRVARTAGNDRLDPPVRLLPDDITDDRMVAVIGYPGSNNGYDPEPFRQLFGDVLAAKRFSPGFYEGRRGESLTYDCSTLPGSSGSVVLDVATGQAVGLHFAGTAFDTNYAVPAADLAAVLRKRPWHGEAPSITRPPLQDLAAAPQAATAKVTTAKLADGGVTFTVPLEITVRFGTPQVAVAAAAGQSATPQLSRDRASAEAAAARVAEHLRGERGVLKVAPGFLFRDGELSDDVGVIVSVAPGSSLDPKAYGLGATVDGVEISVENADPETLLAEQIGLVREAFGGRRARYERDLDDPRFDLSPVEDDMTITLHVSPEAGWPVLKGFLERDEGDLLTIGMYHMTAPHVVQAIETIAERADITLSLDRQRGDASPPDDTSGETKADDIPERDTLANLAQIAGERFKWAPASLGSTGLFATAYHIKVAVWSEQQDGGEPHDLAFWLSSGNWQSSNQAPLERDPFNDTTITWEDVADYNREWHAVVEHEGLARTLRHHLEQDYEDNLAELDREAVRAPAPDVLVTGPLLERPRKPQIFRAFPPKIIRGRVKAQVLLTPDNYPEVVAQLISRARSRVLVENQSFSFWSTIENTPEHFLKIARALRGRQEAGLDVRVIFRSGFGKERDTLRRMKEFGLEADSKHVRFFDTCHTKGIVIDDDIAVLGSHNWTAGGVGPNRDASLVIWHPEANAYFAELFEYDWEQIAQRRVRSQPGPEEAFRIVPPGVEVPLGRNYHRVSLAELLGET